MVALIRARGGFMRVGGLSEKAKKDYKKEVQAGSRGGCHKKGWGAESPLGTLAEILAYLGKTEKHISGILPFT